MRRADNVGVNSDLRGQVAHGGHQATRGAQRRRPLDGEGVQEADGVVGHVVPDVPETDWEGGGDANVGRPDALIDELPVVDARDAHRHGSRHWSRVDASGRVDAGQAGRDGHICFQQTGKRQGIGRPLHGKHGGAGHAQRHVGGVQR